MNNMTDLEISKALALAIGWKENQIRNGVGANGRPLIQASPVHFARPFDYRDWAVAGPIAAKYDCFPSQGIWGEWHSSYHQRAGAVQADTPQKAIALAVIESTKKWRCASAVSSSGGHGTTARNCTPTTPTCTAGSIGALGELNTKSERAHET